MPPSPKGELKKVYWVSKQFFEAEVDSGENETFSYIPLGDGGIS